MQQGTSKPSSPIKWALGVVGFIAVVGGGMFLGYWITGGRQARGAPPPLVASPILFVIGTILGGLLLVGSALVWLVVTTTHCFTFNFDRPYFRAYGGKLWVANLLVGLLAQAGFALMAFPLIMRLTSDLLPPAAVFAVSFFLPFFLAQVALIWWTPWAPLERAIIRRRAERLGVSQDQIATGTPLGISDPTRSSFSKLTLVEEDFGMFWLTRDSLLYRGDQMAIELPRESVLAVERKTDAGAVSFYFGGVHVIVRYRDSAGAERLIRLHPEGDWTMTAKARALDELAERIESWRISPDPDPQLVSSRAGATGGFPVQPA